MKLQIIAPVEGKSWHIGHTILVDYEARFLVAIPKGELRCNSEAWRLIDLVMVLNCTPTEPLAMFENPLETIENWPGVDNVRDLDGAFSRT